jgi:hypothetical protein
MFRSGRTRPVHARSSGSETLLRIRSLAGSIIGTLESRFRKRQPQGFPPCTVQETLVPQAFLAAFDPSSLERRGLFRMAALPHKPDG